MYKYYYALIALLFFSFSLSLQSQSDCDEVNPIVETKAFLSAHADKSNYDRVWYTKKTIQERIIASFEPREPTEVGYWGVVNLELIIDQNGQVNEISFLKEKHDVIREVVMQALADIGDFQAATIEGQPVCSKLNVRLPTRRVVDVQTGGFLPDLVYKPAQYDQTACQDLPEEEQSLCSQKSMLMDLYRNIRYPAMARESGVEGTLVIAFNIDKTGKAYGHRIVSDIGAGCGQEALSVIKTHLNKWSPALNENGEPINSQITLPVRFKLEGPVRSPKPASTKKKKKRRKKG